MGLRWPTVRLQDQETPWAWPVVRTVRRRRPGPRPSDLSRFGDDVANLALFELASGQDTIVDADAAPISLDDPALEQTMGHHRLSWFDDITN